MKTLDQLQKMLKQDGKAHEKLRNAIMHRIRMSRDKMNERYLQMARNEEQYAAYVPEKDVDNIRKNRKITEGEHDYVSIEVPYSYAVTMTIHTYITSVFLSRNPVYQVTGRHGESEQNTQAMEALLDYQRVAGMHSIPLYVWLFDPLKYGFGVIGQYWDEETVQCRKFKEEVPTFLGMPIPGRKPERVPYVENIRGYFGSKLFNVRPQDFFPDVRVPLAEFQKGEFCARYIEIPWSELYQGQADGRYFNVEFARREDGAEGQIQRDLGSERVTTLPGERIEELATVERPDALFKGYEMQWKCSPRTWGLGDEGRQETWVFTVSKTGTIVEARPLGMYYSGFSYDVILYEPDGYNVFPVAALERIKPLNDVLSWLINTHFYNVRSALNNQFVVDPTMVVMKDVMSRKPGQIIRLKPEAYGRDVRTAITQLPVGDVTRGNLQDAQLVEMMIQRVLGATDNIMGMVTQGGRKTATEVRSSTSFGVNRIKTLCELASAYGMGPMTQRLVQTTQQMYEGDDRKYKLVGDLSSMSPMSMPIDPEAIMGFYDYVPVDGTLPVDRYAQAQLWQALLGQVRNFPEIIQQYDIAKIFAWVATLSGLKNVQQFRIQPQSAERIGQQVQAGNLVPINAAMKDLERVPDAGRINGMGAAG